jgi:hypothetical protein
MPGMMRSPGVAVAVVAAAGVCFGAAYAGGTLTRHAAPAAAHKQAPAAAVTSLPAPRVTALGPAAQIPQLRTPVTRQRKATVKRPAVGQAVAIAAPVRRAPARVVVRTAPVPRPATPVSRPVPTASPPAPKATPQPQAQAQKPTGAKPDASAAITFFDDGGG